MIVPKEEREAAIASLQDNVRQQQQLGQMEQMAGMVPQLQGETAETSPLRAIAEAAA